MRVMGITDRDGNTHRGKGLFGGRFTGRPRTAPSGTLGDGGGFTVAEQAYVAQGRPRGTLGDAAVSREARPSLVDAYHRLRDSLADGSWTPAYEPWRDGLLYVTGIRYPDGRTACVAPDRRDPGGRFTIMTPAGGNGTSYPTRDEAARVEACACLHAWEKTLGQAG